MAVLRCLYFLAFASGVGAVCSGAEDGVCMLQNKEMSLVIKPPDPSGMGLTADDKNFITDAQSGPFYDGDKAAEPAKSPKAKEEKPKAAPTEKPTEKPVEKPKNEDTTTSTWISFWPIVVGLIIAVLLLVFLAGVASTRGAAIAKMSWTLSSQSIIVFCSFLLFKIVKELSKLAVQKWSDEKYNLFSSLEVLLELVVVLYVVLFVVRSRPVTLLALGAMGQFILSFAAIDTFGIVEHMKIFTQADAFGTISMFILGVVAVAVFVALSTSERELLDFSLKNSETCRSFCKCCCCCCFDPEAVNRPAWNEWKKAAMKLEDQLAAVTVGYLFSQAVEFAIEEAKTSYPEDFNFALLSCVIAVLAVLTLCFALLTRGNSDAVPGRVSTVVLNVSLMAIAWCLVGAVEGQLNGGLVGRGLKVKPNSFESSLVVALTISLITVFFYVVFCCYSLSFNTVPWDQTLIRNFQALVFAMGFAIGFSWVTCFLLAVPGIAANFPQQKNVTPDVPAAAIVNALVLPVWVKLIFPSTIIGKSIEDDG